MARGSGKGLIRVPNIGGGPLFVITGNFGALATPRAPTSSDTNINGGNNPYVFAPMWEAKGLSKWLFYIAATNATASISVFGTLSQKTALNPALTTGWFTLPTEAYGSGAPSEKNPLVQNGDALDFDRPLYGITIVVTNFTGSGEIDFYAEAGGD